MTATKERWRQLAHVSNIIVRLGADYYRNLPSLTRLAYIFAVAVIVYLVAIIIYPVAIGNSAF